MEAEVRPISSIEPSLLPRSWPTTALGNVDDLVHSFNLVSLVVLLYIAAIRAGHSTGRDKVLQFVLVAVAPTLLAPLRGRSAFLPKPPSSVATRALMHMAISVSHTK